MIEQNSWERKKQTIDNIVIFYFTGAPGLYQAGGGGGGAAATAGGRGEEGPVEDSQMVDEMFSFIDAQTDLSGDSAGPSAFKVSLWFVLLNSLM